MKTEADGGRHAPFTEGYRPHLVVPPDGEYLGVTATCCAGPVAPGDEAEVQFDLDYHPALDYSALRIGTEFQMREGARTVAIGRVVRRFNDAA
ncbi:hypothetical protein ACFJGW_00995 [Burkholderiaceae bacterium UC74_6]